MSSRRNLKKDLNRTISLLFTDCLIYKLFVVDANLEAVDKIIVKLKDIQNNYICKISVTEGREVKGRVRQYYKKLKSDFASEINEIGKEIAAL